MELTRSSGVLLHPTSFPGRYGVGDLGTEAFKFVDWLAQAGQRWWQVMPLGPTGYGDSPYQAFSAFAGNPYLISFDQLLQDSLFTAEDLAEIPDFPADMVDYGWIYFWKYPMLERAYTAFKAGKAKQLEGDFATFKTAEASWLTDFALFMAVKATQPTTDPMGNECKGAPWNVWPHDIRSREPAAMQRWSSDLALEIDQICFYQFLFFRQWQAVRDYAHSKNIQIIGDIPIFVAMDSADSWANPEQFFFDQQSQPTVVAGVPPDYFSETGQLWGNPLYRWDVMAEQGFSWWIERFKGSLKLYDLIRVDHFRGFEAFWEIEYPAENAIKGEWIKAPGKALFEAVRAALGDLPIIAEDLGVITPGVELLRDEAGFPGMAVLQFAFGGGEDWSENDFLPENLKVNQVVYTGTHDNETTRGWFADILDRLKNPKELELSQAELEHIAKYIPNLTEDKIAWNMLELAWRSRANLAVAPMQDLMNLGAEARMNLPGRLGGNWQWRYKTGALSGFVAQRLNVLTKECKRT